MKLLKAGTDVETTNDHVLVNMLKNVYSFLKVFMKALSHQSVLKRLCVMMPPEARLKLLSHMHDGFKGDVCVDPAGTSRSYTEIIKK